MIDSTDWFCPNRRILAQKIDLNHVIVHLILEENYGLLVGFFQTASSANSMIFVCFDVA